MVSYLLPVFASAVCEAVENKEPPHQTLARPSCLTRRRYKYKAHRSFACMFHIPSSRRQGSCARLPSTLARARRIELSGAAARVPRPSEGKTAGWSGKGGGVVVSSAGGRSTFSAHDDETTSSTTTMMTICSMMTLTTGELSLRRGERGPRCRSCPRRSARLVVVHGGTYSSRDVERLSAG